MRKKVNELQSKVYDYYNLQKKIEETGRAIEDIVRYQREMLVKGKVEYSQEIGETKKELYEKLNMLREERNKLGEEIKGLTYELMGKPGIKEHLRKKIKFLIILVFIPILLFLSKHTGFSIWQQKPSLLAYLISLLLAFIILKILRIL